MSWQGLLCGLVPVIVMQFIFVTWLLDRLFVLKREVRELQTAYKLLQCRRDVLEERLRLQRAVIAEAKPYR